MFSVGWRAVGHKCRSKPVMMRRMAFGREHRSGAAIGAVSIGAHRPGARRRIRAGFQSHFQCWLASGGPQVPFKTRHDASNGVRTRAPKRSGHRGREHRRASAGRQAAYQGGFSRALSVLAFGIRSTSPSSASVIGIWQDSRELSCVDGGEAEHTRLLRIRPAGLRSSHSGSIYTWHVAQAHSPPQSASMPGTLLFTAPLHHRKAQPVSRRSGARRAVEFDVGHFRHRRLFSFFARL